MTSLAIGCRRSAFPWLLSVGIPLLSNALLLRSVASEENRSKNQPTAAAVVNGEPIYLREIDRAVESATARRKVSNEALPALTAGLLDRLIDRRLVAQQLAKGTNAARASEIDGAVRKLEAQLQQQSIKLENHLADIGLSEEELRREIAWKLNWSRAVQIATSDARLQQYFAQHAADYDGRRLRVSHILLPAPADNAPYDRATMLNKVREILDSIERGRTTFEQAAIQYSAGESAKQGGELGWISRHGIMPEAFSRAAFRLKPGEISEPVVTSSGVHLIQCTEMEAGRKTWKDVREELEHALSESLFTRIAAEARRSAKIEYTGVSPYYGENSRELVLPMPELSK